LQRFNLGDRGWMLIMLLIGFIFGVVTLSVILVVHRLLFSP
jgi:hypothetical protein